MNTNCKNCNAPIETDQRFCKFCGAQIINNRLTIKSIAHESYQSFFSIDSNKPLRTFIDMFVKPEEVIGGYVNGTRKKYIHAFGYFTIAITISSLFFFVFLKIFPELLDNAFNFAETSTSQKEFTQKLQKSIFENQTILYFSAIPLMALISWIVFFNKRKYNYAEHLVLNLYAYSQASIIAIFLYVVCVWNATLFGIASFAVIFLQIAFFAYVLKRVFKLTVSQLIIKTLYFLALAFIIYIGIIVLVVIYLAISNNLNVIAPM